LKAIILNYRPNLIFTNILLYFKKTNLNNLQKISIMQSKIASNQVGQVIESFHLTGKNILVMFSGICLFAMFFSGFLSETNQTAAGNILDSNSNDKKNDFTSAIPVVTSTASVSTVVSDAQAFYAMLSPSQQTTLQKNYTTTLAKKWSNLPCGANCRNGIQLGTNLTSPQYEAAMLVIKDALSANANDGYDEYYQMNLAEAYLHANGGGNGYDSTLRWMAFLNTPSTTGAWMLQFGGHHYAANICFNNGHVIGATPFFMGLEPKTFTYNSTSYDPLGDERNAFANLFASLSASELATAHLSTSFNDCTLIPGESNGGSGMFPVTPVGIACSALTIIQQNLVLDVISHYVNDMDSSTAAAVMAVYSNEIANCYISYVGNGTSGNPASFLISQGNYCRIDGPSVWIEFSCQGGIVIQGQIHYHTVWRDKLHDYGVNLTGAAIDSIGTTGIANINIKNSLTLFPNPAGDKITFNLNSEIANATVIIINAATGQLVKKVGNFSGQIFNTDISTLSAGSYILKVQDAGSIVYVGKFTKK
jgi:hypothetical protein